MLLERLRYGNATWGDIKMRFKLMYEPKIS